MPITDIKEREDAAKKYQALCEAEDAEYGAPHTISDDDYKKLEQAAKEAMDAYEALPRGLLTDSDGNIVRCAFSNLPIWEDEETVVVIKEVADGRKKLERV